MLFRRTMRWSDNDFVFIRPIRWIVAMLGDQIVDFEVAGVRSGNISYGHRFLAPEPFTVTSVEQYMQELTKRFVVLDPVERRRIIRESGDKLGAEKGGKVVWDEELLGVVANQVEAPQVLLGDYAPEYVRLPRKLIEATLTGYQKYFPVAGADGKLLPHFLAVYDSDPAAEATIRHGNQSALSARLSDAAFFFDHDQASGLEKMRAATTGRGYLPGLGSVLDKSERLIKLCSYLADKLEGKNKVLVLNREALAQAAYYAKADLESAVVGEKEFAHLQGEMGYHYALVQKLHVQAAEAIREHYEPRNAGDTPALTVEGRILAIADKLDHLTALAVIGKLPKGGDDPFAARRAAVGIILNILGISEKQIALKNNAMGFNFFINSLVGTSLDVIGGDVAFVEVLENFIKDRFTNLIDDYKIIRKDYLNGISENHSDDLFSCYSRILLLEYAISNLPEWQPLAESAKRCRNILDAARRQGIFIRSGDCRLSSMKLAEEINLFHILESLFNDFGNDNSKYYLIGSELSHFKILSKLRDPLHAFFDKVFVMDSDDAIRDNRLSLLAKIYEFIGGIMDFSRIEIVTRSK